MRVRLDGDHYTIGRLTTNDIALPYPHISRQHAELRLHGRTWWVVDLHSKNGLHIGGQRVHETQLAPGAPVMLSPLIMVSLLADAAQGQPRPPIAWATQAPPSQPMTWANQPAPSQPMSYAQYAPPSQPVPWATQSPPSHAPSQASATSFPSSPASEPITPLSALGPRSVYSDDEAPFYPHMRPASHRGAHPTYAAPPMPQMPHTPVRPAPYPPVAAHSARDSWSNPAQPGGVNPQQQAAMAYEQRRSATAGPSPLLHLCQTCGQRTPPDAVFCQNCHHAIASECMRCRLSLLPIQDNCPRCQTPNPASVRRASHSGRPF